MSKISVIVPNFNHAEYIEACLDSIYFQSHEDIEIIIIDDCSSDDSRNVIVEWMKRVSQEETSYASYYDNVSDSIARSIHKRYNKQGRRTIQLLVNDENRGSTWTYNRGFKEATGDYCTFVASDDLCNSLLFATLAEPLDNDLADFVYTDMFVIDDNCRILREFKLPKYSFENSFCRWYLCGVATLYRRSLHLQYGYYNESAKADDHECYLRFAMNNARFLHIPKTLYSVRSHHSRQVGLHSESRFSALLEHSKELTLKARAWLDSQNKKG